MCAHVWVKERLVIAEAFVEKTSLLHWIALLLCQWSIDYICLPINIPTLFFPLNHLPSGIGVFLTTLMQIAVKRRKWWNVECCWLLAAVSAVAFWFSTKKKKKKERQTDHQPSAWQRADTARRPVWILICYLEGRLCSNTEPLWVSSITYCALLSTQPL